MAVRPLLRPGSAVLRRDARHLQVGTTPGVIVRDEPGAAAVLRHADGVRVAEELADIARRAGSSRGPALVAELIARGALVVAPLGGRRPRVDLRHDAAGTRVAHILRALLEEDAVFDDGPQALVVTVTVGEPARATFRAMNDHRIAHLPVTLLDDRVRVGPLVLPGHTPCLDCFDLQQAASDPHWPALVTQFGVTRPARIGATTASLGLAAAETARAVGELGAGHLPHLAGRAVLLGPSPAQSVTSLVGFHHRCGCHLLAA